MISETHKRFVVDMEMGKWRWGSGMFDSTDSQKSGRVWKWRAGEDYFRDIEGNEKMVFKCTEKNPSENALHKIWSFPVKISSFFVQWRSWFMYSSSYLISRNNGKRFNFGTARCAKNVQIRVFFRSVFSHIWTEYGDLLRKSPYSVQIRENTDQKKLGIWTFFAQWQVQNLIRTIDSFYKERLQISNSYQTYSIKKRLFWKTCRTITRKRLPLGLNACCKAEILLYRDSIIDTFV